MSSSSLTCRITLAISIISIVLLSLFLNNSAYSQTGNENSVGTTRSTIEWKTYHEPSKFSIDYPTFNGTANITEGSPGVLIISIPGFSISIISIGTTELDPQEQAVATRIQDINRSLA